MKRLCDLWPRLLECVPGGVRHTSGRTQSEVDIHEGRFLGAHVLRFGLLVDVQSVLSQEGLRHHRTGQIGTRSETDGSRLEIADTPDVRACWNHNQPAYHVTRAGDDLVAVVLPWDNKVRIQHGKVQLAVSNLCFIIRVIPS